MNRTVVPHRREGTEINKEEEGKKLPLAPSTRSFCHEGEDGSTESDEHVLSLRVCFPRRKLRQTTKLSAY